MIEHLFKRIFNFTRWFFKYFPVAIILFVIIAFLATGLPLRVKANDLSLDLKNWWGIVSSVFVHAYPAHFYTDMFFLIVACWLLNSLIKNKRISWCVFLMTSLFTNVSAYIILHFTESSIKIMGASSGVVGVLSMAIIINGELIIKMWIRHYKIWKQIKSQNHHFKLWNPMLKTYDSKDNSNVNLKESLYHYLPNGLYIKLLILVCSILCFLNFSFLYIEPYTLLVHILGCFFGIIYASYYLIGNYRKSK